MIVVGAGRAGAARRRPRARRGPGDRRERAAWSAADWNGFNVLHRAAARVGGLDLGFVPGPGGRDVAGILAGCRSGDDRGALSARRRRDRSHRHRLGLCDLSGPSRRPRRGARRCRAAGLRLYREGRDLRQYRGPGAARPPRRVPARRGARGLGDPAGAVGRARAAAAVRFAPRACASGCEPPIRTFARIDEIVPRRMGRVRRERRPVEPAPFVYPIADYYRTDPISRASPTMAECSETVRRRARTKPRPAADRHAWLDFWSATRWPTAIIVDRGPDRRRAAAAGDRLLHLRRAQGAGLLAAAQRARTSSGRSGCCSRSPTG